MSYTVFARKYRPQTFDDVIGQEHITTTLKNAIQQERLAHAYLFVGPRGTGKTSTARIMAKALNCVNGPTLTPCGQCDACKEIAAGNSLDVLEFDAASNTQVDKIRDLIIDNVKYAPTRGRYKLYIVDEVHMLSNSSFNALLKTLEEPPAHVKFIFATTDPQKVPSTIVSRCQRFDLKRIPTPLIAQHLLDIASKENIQLSPQAADTLARGADGGMRDAESMLDQLVAFCGETIEDEDVQKIFGFTSKQNILALVDYLIACDLPNALHLINSQAQAGKDLGRLMADLIDHLRTLLIAKADPDALKQDLDQESLDAVLAQCALLEMDKLLDLIEQFAASEARMKWASNKKMHFEIAAIRASQTLAQASLNEVLEALTALGQGKDIPPTSRPTPPATTPPVRRTVQPPAPSKAEPAAQKTEPPSAPPARSPAPSQAVAAPAAPAPVASPVPGPEPVSKENTAPEPVLDSRPQSPAPAPAAPIAPAPTAEAQPAAPSLESLWNNLTSEVSRSRPLIKMWIQMATPLELQPDQLVIGFPPEQSLAMEGCDQPAHRRYLDDTLTRLTGKPCRLKMILRDGLQVKEPDLEPAASTPARDPLEEFKDDPLIRKALDLFRSQLETA